MSFVKYCLFLAFASLSCAQNARLKDVYQVQVQNEFLASNVYLTFAHRLATDGLYPGFADFFFDSATEEREHGVHLIDFYNVNSFNSDLHLGDIDINSTFTSMDQLPKMIRAATILEQSVLDSLNRVRSVAETAGDFSAVHFIEKVMLEEQVVALKVMKDLSQRLVQAGESRLFLQMLDRQLRKERSSKA